MLWLIGEKKKNYEQKNEYQKKIIIKNDWNHLKGRKREEDDYKLKINNIYIIYINYNIKDIFFI